MQHFAKARHARAAFVIDGALTVEVAAGTHALDKVTSLTVMLPPTDKPYYHVVLRHALPSAGGGILCLSWGLFPASTVDLAQPTRITPAQCVRLPDATILEALPCYQGVADDIPKVFTLGDAQDALAQRLEWYTVAPHSTATNLTPRVRTETEQDTLSYLLMMWVGARFKGVRPVILWGERLLLLQRLRYAHHRGAPTVASLLGPDAQLRGDLVGLPFEQATAWLVWARTHLAAGGLDGGVLWMPPAAWVPCLIQRMERVHRACMESMETQRLPLYLRPYLDEMYGQLCILELADMPAPPQPRIPVRLLVAPSSREGGIEGLLMPKCISQLAHKGLKRGALGHLNFTERGMFYRFVLSSGVDPESFKVALVERFLQEDGVTLVFPRKDRRYGDTTVSREVDSTMRFLERQDPTRYEGDLCDTLLKTGVCPFGSAWKAARAKCHAYMQGRVQRSLPFKEQWWAAKTPLAVAQFSKSFGYSPKALSVSTASSSS